MDSAYRTLLRLRRRPFRNGRFVATLFPFEGLPAPVKCGARHFGRPIERLRFSTERVGITLSGRARAKTLTLLARWFAARAAMLLRSSRFCRRATFTRLRAVLSRTASD